MVAGHQWRVSRGPAAKYLGIETDIMSPTRLSGRDGNGNAWMASLRARYGLTLGETMVYATTGVTLAARQISAGSTSSLPPPGLLAGAGIETAGTSHIRSRLEYLYTHNFSSPDSHMLRAAVISPLN